LDRIYNIHVNDTTLRKFLGQPEMQRLDEESRSIPKACQDCCWLNICGGGGLLAHQYSEKTDSSMHPSVHCDALKELYSETTSFLLNNGMDPQQLKDVLFSNNEIEAVEIT
jgi:radical SAM protein with 4Fe4S-binding SPASM domain